MGPTTSSPNSTLEPRDPDAQEREDQGGYYCVRCEQPYVVALTVMTVDGHVQRKFGCMNCLAVREQATT